MPREEAQNDPSGRAGGQPSPTTNPLRRLHAPPARTNPLRGATRVGGNTQSHRHRGAVIELEQGRISRSWQPDATTSRWRPRPNPGLRMFRLVQHEWEETGMHLRTSGQAPSDRGRQRPPRPGCLIPCHHVSPVALPGRAEGCCCYTFYYSSRDAIGPPPTGKGPGTAEISSGGGI